MNAVLTRFAYLPDVTLGWLTAGPLKLATLEEPWRPDPDGAGGQRREGTLMESCVPDGQYILHPHNGTKIKNVWCLENRTLGVYRQPGDIPPGQPWGRSAILIHAGIDVDSILGCILVGISHAKPSGKYCVVNAPVALDRLRAVLSVGLRHTLQIRPICGTAEAA